MVAVIVVAAAVVVLSMLIIAPEIQNFILQAFTLHSVDFSPTNPNYNARTPLYVVVRTCGMTLV